MSGKTFDWNVSEDSRGPRYVDECGFRIGLASRSHCAAQGYSPRSQVVRRAIAIARERNDSLVRVEYLVAAEGESKRGGSLDASEAMKVAGDPGQSLRRSYARDRRKARRATAKAQADARKAKRAASRKTGSAAKSGKRKRSAAKRSAAAKGGRKT